LAMTLKTYYEVKFQSKKLCIPTPYQYILIIT
jgi:hypothetical protein